MKKINEKFQEIKEKEFNAETFKKDMDFLFTMLIQKIQENYYVLGTITKNEGHKLVNFIEETESIRYIFFKFCCEFSKKEIFDMAFCYYRDLLIEISKIETKVDEICIDVFGGDIAECTMEIQKNKKSIKIINNHNIKEHSTIHQHNEPIYKIIEDLENKRNQLLQC